MKQHIKDHFKKVDPILYSYIDKVDIEDFDYSKPSLFSHLCREIIGQQLSGKVVRVIYGRFEALFPDNHPTPELIEKISVEELRKVGISYAKINSVKDLSKHVLDKTLDLEHLDTLSDEEIMKQLIQVKGIGPWTAEMFLMFTLNREDIFSYGDLGLKKAIQKIYHLKEIPTQKDMEPISLKWKPYRTYASKILWKILDTTA